MDYSFYKDSKANPWYTIGLISTTIIAPTTYLNNWALVTSNITIKFLIDKCPFLLEALAQIDINIFPFQ
jgi:hypothetical protein